MFSGAIIAAGGHTAKTGTARIRRQQADLIAYGQLFIVNPDLPDRFKLGAPLNRPHRSTFYAETRQAIRLPSPEPAIQQADRVN
jgi:N-ethylmaleimide reductase